MGGGTRKNTTYGKWAQRKRNLEAEQEKKTEKIQREGKKRSIRRGSTCEEKHSADTWEGGLAADERGFEAD